MSDLIEFRHLKYILAVAETCNFTRAAERLFVAQPSLSRQIKDIEVELGFRIFERAREGVQTTPAGQMIVEYARETLAGRTQIVKVAKEVHLGKISPLRLGFSPFTNSRHLRTFRAAYESLFPKCGIRLSSGDPIHILQRLERGDLDCAVLSMPVMGNEWILYQLARTPLVVCMRTDDVLAAESRVDLETLAQRLTIFRDPEGHPGAHARLLQMFAEAGLTLHISCSAATPQDIQLLVRDGYGVALVDEDLVLQPDLTTRRIKGMEWTDDIVFAWHISGGHAALPFLNQILSKGSRKAQKSVRSQLPLRFDISA